jgi:hypothetical protein
LFNSDSAASLFGKWGFSVSFREERTTALVKGLRSGNEKVVTQRLIIISIKTTEIETYLMKDRGLDRIQESVDHHGPILVLLLDK